MNVKIAVLNGLKQNMKTVVLNVAVVDTLKSRSKNMLNIKTQKNKEKPMSNIGSYYMELTEQASVLTLREFCDKYGDTWENQNVWFEVNDESDHEEESV